MINEQLLKIIEDLELLRANAIVNGRGTDEIDEALKTLMWLYGEWTFYE